MQKLVLWLLLALAACATDTPQPTAAPTGITSNNGGGMRPFSVPLGATRVQ